MTLKKRFLGGNPVLISAILFFYALHNVKLASFITLGYITLFLNEHNVR